MALPPGTRLGPYEIQSPLGAGGMGEVYRTRDTRLDRTVAIKVLTSYLSDNPELKQRFEREAKAISSLNHPNIAGDFRFLLSPAKVRIEISTRGCEPWLFEGPFYEVGIPAMEIRTPIALKAFGTRQLAVRLRKLHE
jgi:serine/threonine protein kinase